MYLTKREKRFMFALRFKKKIKPRFDVSALASAGYVSRNYSDQKNVIGEYISLDTYSLTDTGRRYFIERRDQFFTRKLPVAISLIALAKSFWPELSALFGWVMEAVDGITTRFLP